MSILLLFIIAVCLLVYAVKFFRRTKGNSVKSQTEEAPTNFDLLDDNGDPINYSDDRVQSSEAPHIRVVVGSDEGKDSPVQELRYFCIKDKGYHVSAWPKDQSQFDIIEFPIAGMSHRDNIDDYLGEFKGTLEAEPTNPYDTNAIKVLAPDGHHVGYVHKDITAEIRNETNLPCSCFCYIGCNKKTYFSDCYIQRKNP